MGFDKTAKATANDELRFTHIGIASDGAVIFCAMDNGKTYAMPICALERAEEWDPEVRPKTASIIHDGYAAVVKFDTGTSIDFPSDFVLHICDPAYYWHKDKSRAVSGIGQRIRDIREARGLTLDALAAKCGIAKPNLSRLENDKVSPKFETIRAVASGLGVDPALLLPKYARQTTLHAFAQWKRRLIPQEGRPSAHPTAVDLVKVFLRRYPEHAYARRELLKRVDLLPHNSKGFSVWLDREKWEQEKADAR